MLNPVPSEKGPKVYTVRKSLELQPIGTLLGYQSPGTSECPDPISYRINEREDPESTLKKKKICCCLLGAEHAVSQQTHALSYRGSR